MVVKRAQKEQPAADSGDRAAGVTSTPCSRVPPDRLSALGSCGVTPAFTVMFVAL